MTRFKRAILPYALIAFIICLHCATSYAQSKWRGILDRYEAICNECIELKIRADAGEKISSAKISTLLNQLATMRREIREGTSAMSQEERARFDNIRRRYYAIFYPDSYRKQLERDESSSQNQSAPPAATPQSGIAATQSAAANGAQQRFLASATAAKPKSVEHLAITIPIPQVDAGSLQTTLPQAIAAPYATGAGKTLPNRSGVPQEQPSLQSRLKLLHYGIMFCVGLTPNTSYGLRLSISGRESGWGGYIKYRSNFTACNTSYQCKSDGTTTGSTTAGSTIWTSGNTRHSLQLFAAGARVRICTIGTVEIGCSAGMGYGKYIAAWEDISNNWAEVTDYSHRGMVLDGGAEITLGMLELHIGGSTIGFKHHNLELGIGIRF